MNVVQISAEPRNESGKRAAKLVRAEGKIPAVLYSKNGVTSFTTNHNDVKPVIFTPDLKLAEIQIGSSSHKAIVQKVDFHPVTDEIEHIDFLELVEGHALKADVPVRFKGESPGVKNGGKLIRNIRTVKIKTTPEDLVDELFVDISKLKLGGTIRVKAIEVPEGIEVMVDPSTPVASVVVPRALKGDAELEEEEQEEEETTEEQEAANEE